MASWSWVLEVKVVRTGHVAVCRSSGHMPKPFEHFGIDSVCYRFVYLQGHSHCFGFYSIAQLHTGDGSQTSHFECVQYCAFSSDFMVHVSAAYVVIGRMRNSGLHFRGTHTLWPARLRCNLVLRLGHLGMWSYISRHFSSCPSCCTMCLAVCYFLSAYQKMAESKVVSSSYLISIEKVSVGAHY